MASTASGLSKPCRRNEYNDKEKRQKSRKGVMIQLTQYVCAMCSAKHACMHDLSMHPCITPTNLIHSNLLLLQELLCGSQSACYQNKIFKRWQHELTLISSSWIAMRRTSNMVANTCTSHRHLSPRPVVPDPSTGRNATTPRQDVGVTRSDLVKQSNS